MSWTMTGPDDDSSEELWGLDEMEHLALLEQQDQDDSDPDAAELGGTRDGAETTTSNTLEGDDMTTDQTTHDTAAETTPDDVLVVILDATELPEVDCGDYLATPVCRLERIDEHCVMVTPNDCYEADEGTLRRIAIAELTSGDLELFQQRYSYPEHEQVRLAPWDRRLEHPVPLDALDDAVKAAPRSLGEWRPRNIPSCHCSEVEGLTLGPVEVEHFTRLQTTRPDWARDDSQAVQQVEICDPATFDALTLEFDDPEALAALAALFTAASARLSAAQSRMNRVRDRAREDERGGDAR